MPLTTGKTTVVDAVDQSQYEYLRTVLHVCACYSVPRTDTEDVAEAVPEPLLPNLFIYMCYQNYMVAVTRKLLNLLSDALKMSTRIGSVHTEHDLILVAEKRNLIVCTIFPSVLKSRF